MCNIFLFKLYSIAYDENEKESVFILFMKKIEQRVKLP